MIRPITLGPFLRGVNASTDSYSIPKGSVPRSSNLIMSSRGALTPVDGTALINAFNGDVQSNRGRFLAATLFSPQGVPSYYMALVRASDQHLGAPFNLTESLTTGTLTGTYKYEVTALDGQGGETTASNEVTASPSGQGVLLTWNVVPNAYAYNIYRTPIGGGSGTEVLQIGANLPVLQPSPLTATVSFTDGGAASSGGFPGGGYTISTIEVVGNNTITGRAQVVLSTPNSSSFFVGKSVKITGTTGALNTNIGSVYSIDDASTLTVSSTDYKKPNHNTGDLGTGGTITDPAGPPVSDTTQQTALFQFPLRTVSYTNANIVALFPATPNSLGTAPAGSQAKSTPSGGVPGMVSMIPQFKQFTNRLIIALGNGFPVQIFWDSSGTTTNPAPSGAITAISVDANGVVTVTTSAVIQTTDPTKNTFVTAGMNVVLAGITNTAYNIAGVVTSINTGAKTFTLFVPSLIGQGASSGGTWTMTTAPLISTFIPAYAKWTTAVGYATGSIIVPATQPSPPIYLIALQGGVTSGAEPTWPTGFTPGQDINIADGSVVIWHVAGLLNSAAPPPPGAGHIEVYANALWLFNTSWQNTSTGLDGPCSLRMSSAGNPFSYNPVNQAFIDKDDGYEGMGMAKFTITALGIPPEGSLVLMKNRSPYQVIGVFGSSNLVIQSVSSDMGCIAPRTILFVPGFGITRMTHLGVAIFSGVKDEVVSEEIRPFLSYSNDNNTQDIAVADPAFVPLSWAALTSNPPQYVIFAPISTTAGVPVPGSSNWQLTRTFNLDLILRHFMVIDFPFPLGCAAQVQSQSSSTPVTIIGGFSDGVLQQWQNGDVQWYTGSISPGPSKVQFSVKMPDIYSQNPDQKMQCRRLVIRGVSTSAGSLTVAVIVNGVQRTKQTYTLPATGDFDVFAGIQMSALRFSAILSGSGHTEIDRVIFHAVPKATGVPSVVA
jgi:hypothetical protein